MAEYMNKELFLSSMGLRGDETKYGNRDGEHQHRSYSTYMSYEIMDCVEDIIEEDVVPVVRCKDCKHYYRYTGISDERVCGIFNGCYENTGYPTELDDFCSYGERRADNEP